MILMLRFFFYAFSTWFLVSLFKNPPALKRRILPDEIFQGSFIFSNNYTMLNYISKVLKIRDKSFKLFAKVYCGFFNDLQKNPAKNSAKN